MRATSFLAAFPRWLMLSLSLLGTQAFAQYAPQPDGSILLASGTANRYLVAGGARFFIPPAQHSLFTGLIFALPQATIDSYTQIPREGTLFRQYNQSQVYVVAGQMYWFIPTAAELDYWDDWKTVNVIPNTNWSDPFYNHIMATQVMVIERSTSQVYLWAGGAKYPLTAPADLAYYGGWANVKTVPLGTLANTTSQPACGAHLREQSSSTMYIMGYINSSIPTMWKAVTTSTIGAIVPDGVLSSFPTSPGGIECIW